MYGRLRSFLLFLPIPLLILVLFLWLRSYLPEHYFIRSRQGQIVIFFANQPVWFEPSSTQYMATPQLIKYLEGVASVQGLPNANWMGFRWVGLAHNYSGMVFIPYWFVALLLAIPSGWLLFTRRSRRLRALPGHCRGCGYDLRASEDKCPECGMVVSGAGGKLAASSSAA